MPPHDRLTVLDVLRGIAILGTLGTNIWVFMYPGGLLGYMESGWGRASEAHWAVLALQQLTQGKFLGLIPCGDLGVGAVKTKLIGLDLSYQAALYEERTIAGNRNPTVNGLYKTTLHTGGVSIRVAF